MAKTKGQTSEHKIGAEKGHCPKCGPDRNADVVASHEEHWNHDELPIWTNDTFNILKCRGCSTVYVQRQHLFSEDEGYSINPRTGEEESFILPTITYWPAPARRDRPKWLGDLRDENLRALLDEVYGALDTDLPVLAAIGTRTVLDRAMILKGANEARGFAEKLEELRGAGLISQDEEGMLIVLTDAGSAAAHRGWRPSPEMLKTLLDGTEAFIHRTLIMGDAVNAMKGHVPEKPKRPGKPKK